MPIIDVDDHLYAWSSRFGLSLACFVAFVGLCWQVYNIWKQFLSKNTKKFKTVPKSVLFSIILCILIIGQSIASFLVVSSRIDNLNYCSLLIDIASTFYAATKWSLYMLLCFRAGT